MKLFQVLWGYITIAAVTRFFIEIVSLLLPVNHKTIFFLALLILNYLFIRVLPLKDSSYPLGFHMELRNLDPH